MKQISEKKKVLIVFLILLGASIAVDVSKESLGNGVIERGEIGDEGKEYQLTLDIENIVKDYEYTLEVSPALPTEKEAKEQIALAIEQIEQDFEETGTEVPIQKTYLEGTVKAKWSFQPYGIIDSSGKVMQNKLEEDTVIQVGVNLSCGAYEREYEFSYLLMKPQLTEEQELLQKVEISLEEQLQKEGNTTIKLPEELDGKSLVWSEKREYITPQMLLLEIVAVVLLWFVQKRKQKEDEKKRIQEMELDYPDIVSQLSLLLGAGMTTRQAWNRLATQYNFKRKNGMVAKRPVYESILRMNGRLLEGESERNAYEQFRMEIPASCYHKLMRILLGNLEKGSQGICVRLEEESQSAFEQRILQAKKRGEEASTKMLGPLILMLLIVMGIVMVPALIGFQI